jgi:hypothetical protein
MERGLFFFRPSVLVSVSGKNFGESIEYGKLLTVDDRNFPLMKRNTDFFSFTRPCCFPSVEKILAKALNMENCLLFTVYC